MANLQKTTFGIGLSILGSGIGGFGAALLWINYGSYAKKLCVMNKEENQQGQYFAYLGSITFTSSILGPTITTFALGFFSTQIYFTILTAIGIVAIIFCSLFIKDI